MNKTIAGMVGALAIVAPFAVMAAPANPMAAAGYADMIKPIPNTNGTLEASDATLRAEDGAKVETVQFFRHRHHGFYHRGFHRHHFHRGFGFRHHRGFGYRHHRHFF